jgi:hypothetical protein
MNSVECNQCVSWQQQQTSKGKGLYIDHNPRLDASSVVGYSPTYWFLFRLLLEVRSLPTPILS